MGIGTGVGENRATTAARMAVASPLLEISIDGAKGILFNITGGPDLTMNEVNEAAKIIAETADADANIIFGATIDEDMVDQVKISVIGTGFDENRQRLQQFTSPKAVPDRPQGPDGEEKTKSDEEKPEKDGEIDQYEDELDIPAFLRQGR